MTIYTVHQPPPKRRAARRGPDRFRFVRDGFYFWAFLLTPAWLLWHRLWLAFIIYGVAVVALNVGMLAAGMSPGAMLCVGLLLSILFGLEAGTLRRWTLQRRGWRDLGLVAADGVEAAERRFFDDWSGGLATSAATAATAATVRPPPRRAAASGSDILGLFPEPGGPR